MVLRRFTRTPSVTHPLLALACNEGNGSHSAATGGRKRRKLKENKRDPMSRLVKSM